MIPYTNNNYPNYLFSSGQAPPYYYNVINTSRQTLIQLHQILVIFKVMIIRKMIKIKEEIMIN